MSPHRLPVNSQSVGHTHRELPKGRLQLTELLSPSATNYFTVFYGTTKINYLWLCAVHALGWVRS